MKREVFPLTDMEKHFKQEYENGGRDLLRRPMSYNEYELISQEKRRYYIESEAYHEMVTMNTPGNTVKEISEEGNHVDVVLHRRYSYPVMHNHAYIELAYVYSGECTHFVEKQTFTMKEGDVCILAPNAMHAISAESDDTVIINIMMSKKMFDHSFLRLLKSGPVVSEFLEHILYNKQSSPYLIFPTGTDAVMHDLTYAIYRESWEKDYLYNESVTLYVKHAFIYLIRNYEMMAIVSNPLDNSQENNIVALMGYITVNYNHITLKQVAQFFGYNETYLGQIIRKYTNKSFCTLVTELQMENARRLLDESGMSITEVSYEVGCYDSSHFIRKFKKAYGVSPSVYRKQNGREE